MTLRLDDIGKKKDTATFLDFAKATANNEEEFRKIYDRLPEFKIKPEKIKSDDITIYEWPPVRQKKHLKKLKKSKIYPFANPVPVEVRDLNLDELFSLSISWNMLTNMRPKNKLDEEYFSRMIELGKLRLSTQNKEKKMPDSEFLRKMKNKAGILETRYVSCTECGDELCQKETCCVFPYENYKRSNIQDFSRKTPIQERGRQKHRTKKKPRRKSWAGTTRTKPKKQKSRERSVSGPRSKSKERNKKSRRKELKSRSAQTAEEDETDSNEINKIVVVRKKKSMRKIKKKNSYRSNSEPIATK